MRVLVTGATGYVGREVAAALAEAGHETRGLVRPGSTSPVPAGVTASAQIPSWTVWSNSRRPNSSGSAAHDGCFLAEDRGLAVKGQHVDVFTGQRETTELWNRLVPTGRGVTVVLDSHRCKRAN